MSPSGYLNVRLDRNLLASARERARLEDRTIASLTRNALRAYLNGGEHWQTADRDGSDERSETA